MMALGLSLEEEQRAPLCSSPSTKELRTGSSEGQWLPKGQGKFGEKGTAARLKTGHTKREGGGGHRYTRRQAVRGSQETQKSERETRFLIRTFFGHEVGLAHDTENVLIFDLC